MRRWLTLLLGFGVSAFFAWLGFRNLNFSELFDILKDINLLWLAAAAVVYFGATYVRVWRWHFLLEPIKPIPPRRLFSTVVIGYMGNNIYPARIGEFVRAYLLKRNEQIPYVPTLATILVERVFDGLVMLTFIFTALLFVSFDEPLLKTIIQVTAPLFFGALLVFIGLVLRPDRTRQLYIWGINRFVPSALREKILDLADKFLHGLSALRNPRLLALTGFTSLLSWIIEAGTYWLVLQAFDADVSFWVLMLVIGFTNLTTILPSTPGYVGTFHGVVVLTLEAFKVAGEQAGAYAIVVHMVVWLPITVVGLGLLGRTGLSWRDLGQATEQVEEESEATS